MKKLLTRNVEVDIVSLQQVEPVLEMKMKSKKTHKVGNLVAATDDALLRKAETEQSRQALRASTAMQTRAVCNARVDE